MDDWLQLMSQGHWLATFTMRCGLNMTYTLYNAIFWTCCYSWFSYLSWTRHDRYDKLSSVNTHYKMQSNPNKTENFKEYYKTQDNSIATSYIICFWQQCSQETDPPTWTHLLMMSWVTIETSDIKSSINCFGKHIFLGSINLSAFTKCSPMLFVYHNTTHYSYHTLTISTLHTHIHAPLSGTNHVSRCSIKYLAVPNNSHLCDCACAISQSLMRRCLFVRYSYS